MESHSVQKIAGVTESSSCDEVLVGDRMHAVIHVVGSAKGKSRVKTHGLSDGDENPPLPVSIAINGKFMSQRLTGVQRVAHELTRALSQLQSAHPDTVLFVPRDVDAGAFPETMTRWLVSRFRGVVWEQIALPVTTRGHMLLSLCNMGPVMKRKQVVMIHDAAIFDAPEGYSRGFRIWYRFAFALLSRSASHIVTVSEYSKTRIVAKLGISADRVSVVPNGVDHLERVSSDISILKRLDLTFDRFALFVGSLAPNKNLDRMLEAVALLARKRDDLKFVVVGGSNAKIFGRRELLHDFGAAAVVHAGYVSDAELKALYENAACFVFPSLYEGFGLPPLEAMHCGCPVISSREAALPEVCGDAALFCDARSSEDIARKLEHLMDDVRVRRAMRIKGKEHAQRYRWSRSAMTLMQILRSME